MASVKYIKQASIVWWERYYRWMVRQNFFGWWYLSCNPNSMKKQDLVREMQIKTRRRYHLICIRRDIIGGKKRKEDLARMWTNQNPYTLMVGDVN